MIAIDSGLHDRGFLLALDGPTVFISNASRNRKAWGPLGGQDNEKVKWNNRLAHQVAALFELAAVLQVREIKAISEALRATPPQNALTPKLAVSGT